MENESKSKDLEMLKHKAVPGYKLIFYITITIAVFYLGYIFLYSH